MTTERVAELAAKVVGKRLQRAQDVAGIVWVREHSGRRYCLVPSGTDRGRFHRVDGFGCRCVGYQHHGHCRHHDAVMLRLVKRAGANPAPEYTTARAEDEPSAEFERWCAEMDAEQAMRDLYGDAA